MNLAPLRNFRAGGKTFTIGWTCKSSYNFGKAKRAWYVTFNKTIRTKIVMDKAAIAAKRFVRKAYHLKPRTKLRVERYYMDNFVWVYVPIPRARKDKKAA